jgi:hypothetical protein
MPSPDPRHFSLFANSMGADGWPAGGTGVTSSLFYCTSEFRGRPTQFRIKLGELSPGSTGRDNTETRRCGGHRSRAFVARGPACVGRTGEEAVQGRGARGARASREPPLANGRRVRRVLGRKNTVPGRTREEPGTSGRSRDPEGAADTTRSGTAAVAEKARFRRKPLMGRSFKDFGP